MPDKYEGYTEVSYYESSDNLGFKLLLKIEGGVTEKVRDVVRNVTYDLDRHLRMAIAEDDPKTAEKRSEMRDELLSLFPGKPYSCDVIPNQYCSGYCCIGRPWLKVRWHPGMSPIVIGWRKRVIEIRWYGESPIVLFPSEEVTKSHTSDKEQMQYIHAWGLDKAKEYLKKLLT